MNVQPFWLRTGVLSAVCISCLSVRVLAVGATFTPLGDLPGGDFYSQAFAVSADGTTVVGWSRGSDPGIPFQVSHEAFRWTQADGMVGLGDVDSAFVYSRGVAVSADGQIIVGSASLGAGDRDIVAFRWTPTTGIASLINPDGQTAPMRAFGMSSDGSTVVGVFNPITGGTTGARWTASEGVVPIGSLPNSLGFPDAFATGASATGSAISGQSLGAFVQPTFWSPAAGLVGLGDVPGGIEYALGWNISADGSTVVGGARTLFGPTSSRDEAFLWREPTGFVTLDPRHGQDFGSFAQATSADGSVVVGTSDPGAFIWDAAHGMRLIADVLTNDFHLDMTGWSLASADSVSADGTVIVGSGFNPNGDQEAWIISLPLTAGVPVIPTTSSWGLCVAMLLLLCVGTCVYRNLELDQADS